MKPWALLLALSLAGCTAKRTVQTPVPSAALAPQPPVSEPKPPVTVVVHLCAVNIDTPDCAARLAKRDYLQDLRDHIALEIEEFEKAGKDIVDLNLRKRMDAIEKRAEKERPE